MRTEATFRHGAPQKTALLLVNLGTPDHAEVPSVRAYLQEFLSDPRVIEVPKLIWWFILNVIILWFRTPKTTQKYASIWTEEGSPLLAFSKKLQAKLSESFKVRRWDVHVELAMRYGNPSVAGRMDDLRKQGYDRVLVFPLYPQYSAATTASVFDAVAQWAQPVRNLPELRFVKHYHDHPGYIHALTEHIQRHWAAHGKPNFAQGDVLVMSFHGMPEFTLHKGDPYHCECQKTARLVAQDLGLDKTHYRVTFQSRFGRTKWLQPYTDATLHALGQQGIARVDVFCPGFLADCLETLEEINQEVRATFQQAGGGEFHYIPCLNDSDLAAAMLAEITAQHLQGWPVDFGYEESMAAELASSRQIALEMGAG